jgi:protocatechuate 3,4-dioxygenase beta subunit
MPVQFKQLTSVMLKIELFAMMVGLQMLVGACSPQVQNQPASPTSHAFVQMTATPFPTATHTTLAPTLVAVSPTVPAITSETATANPPTPVTITQFTPVQAEGPYYPPQKPVDKDNDLTIVVGNAGTALGDIIQITGKVFGKDGLPIAGAVVEIWQTDHAGIYLHPNDPRFAARDVNFQSYGESTSGENGDYSFKTILPGVYEGRPPHIHVIVRYQGQEILTTQFYFPQNTNGAFVSEDELDMVLIELTPDILQVPTAQLDLFLDWLVP